MPTILGPADPSGQIGQVHTQAVPVAQHKIPRSDRLEVSVARFGFFRYPDIFVEPTSYISIDCALLEARF